MQNQVCEKTHWGSTKKDRGEACLLKSDLLGMIGRKSRRKGSKRLLSGTPFETGEYGVEKSKQSLGKIRALRIEKVHRPKRGVQRALCSRRRGVTLGSSERRGKQTMRAPIDPTVCADARGEPYGALRHDFLALTFPLENEKKKKKKRMRDLGKLFGINSSKSEPKGLVGEHRHTAHGYTRHSVFHCQVQQRGTGRDVSVLHGWRVRG